MKRYYQYVEDVTSGTVLACEALKQAVARFERDLADSKKKKGRWYFDEARADKIIAFVEMLKHFEEPFAGKPIILEPWECFFFGQLYGWRDKKTKLRRFKKALLFMGRKQGKTILASALALYEILSKPGIEAYSLATKQLIANKAFKNLQLFIKKNPELTARLTVRKSPSAIINPKNASTFIPLSRDSDLDGLNPAYCIIDELAAQPDGSAYNTLTSGMGTRSEPLTVLISTASASLDNPLIDEYGFAKKILDGTISDDSFLVAIYEYDKADKWDDLSMMQKAAPNLGVSVHLEYYADELKKARLIPSRATEYRTKYCNLWQASGDTWIPDATWMRCSRLASRNRASITPEELASAPCTLGLDFSRIHDWTAMSAYFYIARLRKYLARHWFYIPAAGVDTKANLENAALYSWIEKGIVTTTPGEIIDYEMIYADIEEFARTHNLREVYYDPALSSEFRIRFEEHPRITIVPFRQNAINMGPAAKSWERAIITDEIMDDSPVIRWMVSCTENIAKNDAWVIPSKAGSGKYAKRIDGVISSIMAYQGIAAYVAGENKPRAPMLDLSAVNY